VSTVDTDKIEKEDSLGVEENSKVIVNKCDRLQEPTLNETIIQLTESEDILSESLESLQLKPSYGSWRCQKSSTKVASSVYNLRSLRLLGSLGSLRPIVIDGANVAMAHGLDKNFSVKGIELVVEYFKELGHVSVVAFLKQARFNSCYLENKTSLDRLLQDQNLVLVPYRRVEGVTIEHDDDSTILGRAASTGAIVISRDQYRREYEENVGLRNTIRYGLLAPIFIGDDLMFPSDPLGDSGRTFRLEKFLRF